MAQSILGFSPIEVPQSLFLAAIRGVTQRCLSEVEDFTEYSVPGGGVSYSMQRGFPFYIEEEPYGI